MMDAIVLCSRINSSRIPRKCFTNLNGVSLLEHIINRVIHKFSVVLAIPLREMDEYKYNLPKELRQNPNFYLFGSHFADSPLHRMNAAVEQLKIENVIRVNVDKIFIDPDLIEIVLDNFKKKGLDYVYSSDIVPGAGFEIINKKPLRDAMMKFGEKDVEHVSYAVKSVTENTMRFHAPDCYKRTYRFLIDYPEDINLISLILSQKGSNASLADAIDYMDNHKWASKINHLPRVTAYTCAYNEEKLIERCIQSNESQNFKDMEYIMIDDASTDRTAEIMAEYSLKHHNFKWHRNPKNIGLSASCNIALKMARGKYIIRLDADDYWGDESSIWTLYNAIEKPSIWAENDPIAKEFDIIYPDYISQPDGRAVEGVLHHHAGGAIFRKASLNHLKFSDHLRGFEGLDLFERAKNQLNIGYLRIPLFNYVQREGSMSRTNLEEREKIKKLITGVS